MLGGLSALLDDRAVVDHADPGRPVAALRGALLAGQVPAVSAKSWNWSARSCTSELLAIVLILLCAAIMARGGWV